MKEELENKIDNLIKILDDDPRIIEIVRLKDKLCSNQDIINKMNKLNSIDKYSNEYKELKMELFKDKYFVSFKELEQEINFLILEINSRLKTLTDKRGCTHESN